MDPEDLLSQARQALAAGDHDQAAALARTRQTRAVQDAELHLAWADLLEELGLTTEVIQELNLALRDAPEREVTYRRLAEIYLDQGRPDRAAQVWATLAARQPSREETYHAWGQALLEAGDLEGARRVWTQGRQATGSSLFDRLLATLDQTATSAPAEPEAPVLLPTPAQLAAFVALFAGREGVYARQWVGGSGETGYTPVQEPFTLKVAESHILGHFTVGIYPVRLDNTVNFLAFDFDLAKFALRKALDSQSLWQKYLGRLHEAAVRLVELASSYDLPAYLEDSGFKGRHVWVFLETPVPAGVVKKAGELLLQRLGSLPVEVTAEVFPKQTSVRQGGLGNLIKLPLGYHRRTGRRALFLQPEGEPYQDQLGLLLQVRKAARRAVYALIPRLGQSAAITLPPATPEPAPPEVPWAENAAAKEAIALPGVAAPEIYHLETDVQYQFLLQHCPVLAALAVQVEQSHRLSKDEALVVIHTLGHLEHGPAVVNELLQRCVNTDPTLLLKSRLRGHPMSCPKIRARIPQVTAAVACNCQFELSGGLYPTPLLHLRRLPPTQAAPDLVALQFQTLLQEYLKLKQQQREVQLLLERLEARLAEVFQTAGVEQLQTALGCLRLKKDEQDRPRFVLEL